MLRVFVYGTLKKGQANHYYLNTSTLLGECCTPPIYSLLDMGAYPGVLRHGQHRVCGEVYAIDAGVLRCLDELEEYPRYYDREQNSTPWGPAWIYVLKQCEAGQLLTAGIWEAKHECEY